MAERYSIQDRRYEDERRYEPAQTRGQRSYGEPGYGYVPGYDTEPSRPRYMGGRDRHDRGLLDRAGDEVRSWFGDEEAERRRHWDELHESGHSFSPGRSGGVRADDVMTRNVTTIHHWDTVERAAQLMDRCDCGSLPVVDDGGHLIGVITDRDIAVRVAGRGRDPRRVRVDECMSSDVIACHKYDSIEGCMRQMSKHQIRRLPIVDDSDRIVGIVSQGDLARYAGTYPGRGERRAVADVLCAISEPTHAAHR